MNAAKALEGAAPKVGSGPRRKRTRRTTTRRCLSCGREFSSERAHNRMCPPCRLKSENVFEAPVSVIY